jgi:hypothetical protein
MLHALHFVVQADVIAEFLEIIGGQSEFVTVTGIAVIVKGNDRVNTVIAAVELDYDEYTGVGLGSSCLGHAAEHRWNQRIK